MRIANERGGKEMGVMEAFFTILNLLFYYFAYRLGIIVGKISPKQRNYNGLPNGSYTEEFESDKILIKDSYGKVVRTFVEEDKQKEIV